MKTILLLILSLFLAGSLRANVILVDTYKKTPENTAHIVSVASSELGEADLQNLLRLDDLALPTGDLFTLAYTAVNSGKGSNSNNGANISWNLAGSGIELLGIYVFGGSNGANLYKVEDPAQMISGSATVHTPLTGKSGKYATISHILLLGIQGAPAVPDTGSTVLLFGLGLGFLWVVRR